MKTRFLLLLLPFFPSTPSPTTHLPGPACRLPKPLTIDMHHLQPRQKEEHLAQPSSKDGDGAADGLDQATDGQCRLLIQVCKGCRILSQNFVTET